jgi:transcription elongation factor GreB
VNKAFTREDDSTDDGPDRDSVVDLLPQGAPNYTTPKGLLRVERELTALVSEERARLNDALNEAVSAAVPEESKVAQARKRLAALDRRIAMLQHHLDVAQVIDPQTVQSDEVSFGATVLARDEAGKQRRYTIVGVDEADFARGLISWTSPLARALTGARQGDEVLVRMPRGEEEWLVEEIRYVAVE